MHTTGQALQPTNPNKQPHLIKYTPKIQIQIQIQKNNHHHPFQKPTNSELKTSNFQIIIVNSSRQNKSTHNYRTTLRTMTMNSGPSELELSHGKTVEKELRLWVSCNEKDKKMS